jgi:hypothetical protein
MNVTARTASSGWDCHSARLSSTRSVIVLIVVPGDLDAVDLRQVRLDLAGGHALVIH